MTGTDTSVRHRRPTRVVLLIATARFALAAAALVTAPAAFGHGSRDRTTAAPPPDRAALAEVKHAWRDGRQREAITLPGDGAAWLRLGDQKREVGDAAGARAASGHARLTPSWPQRLPSASSHAAPCARIIERFQLGESLTDADRAFLKTECRR
jgi:hypothetical protein